MKIFLFLVSFFLFAIGLLNILIPSKGKRFFHTLMYFIPFRIWGFIYLIVFFFLWNSISLVKFPIFIRIISLIFFSEGLYLILFSRRKIKKIIEGWMNASNGITRIAGFIFLFLGVFITFLSL